MAFPNEILPLRQQAAIRNQWLKARLERIIPELMARENMDMWIVVCREYNEDPVIMSLLPATSMSARRRTMLIFARGDDGAVERLTLSRYGYEGFYQPAWDPDEEDQHACLARIVRERDPNRIGINASATFAFGDGISHTEFQLLSDAIGEPYASRLITAERLCVGWLERRLAGGNYGVRAPGRNRPPNYRPRLFHRGHPSRYHHYGRCRLVDAADYAGRRI